MHDVFKRIEADDVIERLWRPLDSRGLPRHHVHRLETEVGQGAIMVSRVLDRPRIVIGTNDCVLGKSRGQDIRTIAAATGDIEDGTRCGFAQSAGSPMIAPKMMD